MRYCLIGAWRSSFEGINHARLLLENNQTISSAIERAITDMESDPDIYSAGYGALPNRDGYVEVDAAYMDGDTLGFGAVSAAQKIVHPIQLAYLLSCRKIDTVRAGESVSRFAEQRGIALCETLSEDARIVWDKSHQKKLTVDEVYHFGNMGVVGIDKDGSLAAGLSGSDWFMKRSGTISHVPMVGSGCYADSTIGAVIATGSADDIMRGCLSYEVVRLMSQGISAQKACETALFDHIEKLKKLSMQLGYIALIAIDRLGKWGCATSYPEGFLFVVSDQGGYPAIYLSKNTGAACDISLVNSQFLKDYDQKFNEYLVNLRTP